MLPNTYDLLAGAIVAAIVSAQGVGSRQSSRASSREIYTTSEGESSSYYFVLASLSAVYEAQS